MKIKHKNRQQQRILDEKAAVKGCTAGAGQECGGQENPGTVHFGRRRARLLRIR